MRYATLKALGACALIAASVSTSLAQSTGSVGAGYWHTKGNQIIDSQGNVVRLAGVNWYGFETPDFLAHGLWAQDYKTVLNNIKALGYNVIRMPFSNEMVEKNPVPTNFTKIVGQTPVNQDLVGATALQDMDTLVAYAGSIGLRIILDNHRSNAGASNQENGLWFTPAFPQSNWIADWQALTKRYSDPKFTFNGNPTVIGMDLRNEPHLSPGNTGACWTGDTATNGCPTSSPQNWPVAAQLAGNAILAINPKLLIFVEGNDCYSGVCGWQGGNLIGVKTNPVVLSVPNQLVYSPHDYGPVLFQQAWFNANTTPASLNSIWNQYWGYISAAGTAPVWLGEFGTGNTAADIQNTAPGSQGQWFQSLTTFLHDNPAISWTYWAANGEDSFALLDNNYDATPASALKQSILATNQFPLGGGGNGNPPPPPPPPPPPITCHIGYTITNQWSTGFQVALSINNTGTAPISGWTLTWSFANGQTVTQLWNGAVTQSGPNVSVQSLNYNANIPAGGHYNDAGFTGTLNGATNSIPTSFALNGTPCN